MVRYARENSLSIFFGVLLLAALAGQLFVGLAEYNNQQLLAGLEKVSLGEYATSADFAADVTENWQSEYLQFFLYVTVTVWFVQRGSPESKALGNEGRESDRQQKVGAYADADSPRLAKAGGLATAIYSRSLGLVMAAIFVGSWFGQSVAGWASYNEQRISELQDPLSWLEYLTAADFWSRTLQNWQSEFLAVGSMAILSVYLRERGSPESKPVGEPHESTGVSG